MKLATLAFLGALTQGAFQTTGETPTQDAEIYMVVDVSIDNNMADFFARMISSSFKRLTSVYEDAGYTISGGVAKTGRSDKTCWKAVAPVTTDLDGLYTKIEADNFVADSAAKDRYTWYALMHAAGYEMNLSDDVRRVVIAVTNKLMAWGDEVVLQDISDLTCGKSQPTSQQFVRHVRRSRAGILFAASDSYQAKTEALQKQATDLFDQLNLTDVAVSKSYMWDTSNKSNAFWDAADYLEQLLSPSWIATTSTTLSPEQKVKNCIAEAFECEN